MAYKAHSSNLGYWAKQDLQILRQLLLGQQVTSPTIDHARSTSNRKNGKKLCDYVNTLVSQLSFASLAKLLVVAYTLEITDTPEEIEAIATSVVEANNLAAQATATEVQIKAEQILTAASALKQQAKAAIRPFLSPPQPDQYMHRPVQGIGDCVETAIRHLIAIICTDDQGGITVGTASDAEAGILVIRTSQPG
jgi:hypothetical protein